MTSYDERISYIEGLRRFGEASGYEVSTELLSFLGYPEEGMRIVHIAGTNGKGSTAAFTSNILREAGYRVGLFTSPHLISFRERIRVLEPAGFEKNGSLGDMFPGEISKEDVLRLSETVIEKSKKHSKRLPPTMFDICLAIALLYFKEACCDIVVLETGLGGRLDSTRAVSVVPEVSVITGIGLEHTRYLGDTIEKIALEKAGILRKGTKAVIGMMPQEAADAIKEVCNRQDIPFVFAECLFEKNISDRSSSDEIRFDVPYEYGSVITDTDLGLNGSYQKKNAACAACAAMLLGINDREVIRKGLAGTGFPGRMDVISHDPLIIIDGAHNPDGAKALAGSLVDGYPGQKFVMLSAVMADKDHSDMLQIMAPLCKQMICTALDIPRALPSAEYATEARAIGIDALAEDDFTKAYTYATIQHEPLIIFGSLYFVGFCYENLGVSDV